MGLAFCEDQGPGRERMGLVHIGSESYTGSDDRFRVLKLFRVLNLKQDSVHSKPGPVFNWAPGPVAHLPVPVPCSGIPCSGCGAVSDTRNRNLHVQLHPDSLGPDLGPGSIVRHRPEPASGDSWLAILVQWLKRCFHGLTRGVEGHMAGENGSILSVLQEPANRIGFGLAQRFRLRL